MSSFERSISVSLQHSPQREHFMTEFYFNVVLRFSV